MNNTIDLEAVLAAHAEWLNNYSTGTRAYLGGAYLGGANLGGANLSRAKHDDKTTWPAFWVCPDFGMFTAWKVLAGGILAELIIPAEAKRVSSVVGRKCRAEFAQVVALTKKGVPVAEGFSTSNAPVNLRLRYVAGETVHPATTILRLSVVPESTSLLPVKKLSITLNEDGR